jgi:acyl-CoA synthetase (NDP forming)
MTVYVPPINTSGEEVAGVLAAVGEQSDKPIVSTFLGSEGVPELLRVTDVQGGAAGRGSVPSYAAPESAVRALARVVNYAEWCSRDHGTFQVGLDHRTGDARTLVREVLAAAPRGAILSTEQVHALLACYGIDLWRWINVHTRDEAIAAGEELGWDVVLKAGSEHLRARPDLIHIWRDVNDADHMAEAWDQLTSWTGMRSDTRFFVQKSAPDGIPVSFSVTEDPLFGPLVSFGLAGAPSELLGDRSYGIPPLTDSDAGAMIADLRSSPLLFGYRGSDPVDVDAIQDIILRLASMKDDLPEIAELDLEPVLAGHTGLTALSARAKVVPSADRRGDWYVRRLSKQVVTGDTLA